MSFRDIKFAARRVVHDTMAQPASFYAIPGTSEVAFITARPHNKRGKVGDLAGTNLNYAEDFDRQERVVFWLGQLQGHPDCPLGLPPRGALVIFAPDEAYFVDTVEPVDQQTVTAVVYHATAEQVVGFETPNGQPITVFSQFGDTVWQAEDW